MFFALPTNSTFIVPVTCNNIFVICNVFKVSIMLCNAIKRDQQQIYSKVLLLLIKMSKFTKN